MRRVLLGLALVLAPVAGCDQPDPLAAYKQAQRDACGCKDRPCIEAAEAAVTAAIAGKLILPDGANPVIAEARRCIHAVWTEDHPLPVHAEAPTSATPCDAIVPKVIKALGCTSIPLASLDFLHRMLGEIQTALVARPPTPEMELYDLCVGVSGAVLTTTLHARCP